MEVTGKPRSGVVLQSGLVVVSLCRCKSVDYCCESLHSWVRWPDSSLVWSLGHSTWNVFKKGQGFGNVASKDKGRVLDRPIECRSRILSYSTVFCASSASFGSSGTQAGIHEHDEIQRYCKFEPLVP